MQLTFDDLVELTGRFHPLSQAKVLDRVEIPYRVGADGALRVAWSAVHAVLNAGGRRGMYPRWSGATQSATRY